MSYFPKNKTYILPILLKLSDKSLTQMLATCKYFHEFYNYDKLWNLKTVNKYGAEFLGGDGFQNYCHKKRLFSRARKHEVPAQIYSNEQVWQSHSDFYDILGDEPTRIALEYFSQINTKLRRGDIVWFSFMDAEENFGVTLFDGSSLKPLDNSLDDQFGHIPREFYVLTPNNGDIFPLTYWKKEISTLVWLKVSDLGPIDILVRDRYVFATFTVDDVCYSIISTDVPAASDFLCFTNQDTLDLATLDLAKVQLVEDFKSCLPDQDTLDLAKEQLAQDLKSEFICVDQYYPDFEDNNGFETSKFVPGIRLYLDGRSRL